MATEISVGDRAYVSGFDAFGDVVRTSFLGLQSAPVLLCDDGTLVGIAGEPAKTEVVLTATGKNLVDETIEVPIDVKIVGIEQLSERGVDPAVQTDMFVKWRTLLTKEQQQYYMEQWKQASEAGPDQLSSFLESIVSALSSIPSQ